MFGPFGLQMKYYAHTAEDAEERTLYTLKGGRQTTEKPCLSDLAEEQIGWQSLRTHLINVAEMACDFGKPFGLVMKLTAQGYYTIWENTVTHSSFGCAATD